MLGCPGLTGIQRYCQTVWLARKGFANDVAVSLIDVTATGIRVGLRIRGREWAQPNLGPDRRPADRRRSAQPSEYLDDHHRRHRISQRSVPREDRRSCKI